jgi:hypothetical protein
MSTQLTRQSENGAVQSAEAYVRHTSALGGDREAFDTAVRIARALSESSIMPAAYHNNVANCMVALEYANRLGASVLAVAQNLDVIQGKPSLRGSFLIGTVNASGRFTPIRFRFQGTEGQDDWGCRAVATDRESGEECIGPLITIALAKAEGWTTKTGSKWKNLPELMLMYRSGAWWTRVYCPELSLGLHTSEEVEDFGVLHAASGSPAASLNERLGLALPVQTTTIEDVTGTAEARALFESQAAQVVEFIQRETPSTNGGDPATAEQKDEAHRLAAIVFEPGDERAAVKAWIDCKSPAPNDRQMATLVQKLQIAEKARAEFEQPALIS